MQIEYKGYILIFNENSERWSIEDEHYSRDFPSLKAAKAAVDAFKKIEHFDAIYKDWHEYKLVEVTSFTEDGKSAWVSYKTGKGRAKASITDLYKLNDENKAIIAKMAEFETQITALQKSKEGMASQLIHIK